MLLNRIISSLAILTLCLISTSCEDDNDFNHTPATGTGTLIVNNVSFEDIDVFLDGDFLIQVDEDEKTYQDQEPGVYRVVLIGEDTDLTFREDVDIIETKLTILTVLSTTDGHGNLSVSVNIQ